MRDGGVLRLGDYHLRVRIDEIGAISKLRDWAVQDWTSAGCSNALA